jgi:hypothetical protein
VLISVYEKDECSWCTQSRWIAEERRRGCGEGSEGAEVEIYRGMEK